MSSRRSLKDGAAVGERWKGDKVQIVVNQTPFYGESGGQMGDTGVISSDNARIEITDTQKRGEGLFVHTGTVVDGNGQDWRRGRDDGRSPGRSRIRANHSATHLLHEALREVLGTHVAQKGSLVAPERLRFDVSHPKPMTAEELKQAEDMANEIILQNAPVTTRLMSVDDAIAEGAMALFGEKHARSAGVVAMGQACMAPRATGLTRSNCAAARMCRRPVTSAWCAFSATARSAPAFAAWKPLPVRRRAPISPSRTNA